MIRRRPEPEALVRLSSRRLRQHSEGAQEALEEAARESRADFRTDFGRRLGNGSRSGGAKAGLAGDKLLRDQPGLDNGANLGGLAGADQALPSPGAGSGRRPAHLAGLSEHPRHPAARPSMSATRIGPGPWCNAKGVQIAANVADLHSANNKINKETASTRMARWSKAEATLPNMHDILTGSQGSGAAGEPDSTRGKRVAKGQEAAGGAPRRSPATRRGSTRGPSLATPNTREE